MLNLGGRWQYVCAVGLALAGVVAAWMLQHDGEPVMAGAAMVPVVLAAYAFGRNPGLAATLVATIGTTLLTPNDTLRVALIACNGVVISVLVGLLVDARTSAETTEQLFESMFTDSPRPSIMTRLDDMTIVAVNQAYLQCFGWSREELLASDMTALKRFPDLAQHARLRELLDAHSLVEDFSVSAVRKDGTPLDLIVSLRVVMIGGKRHVISVYDDLTAERAAEKLFTDAFEASPNPQVLVRLTDMTFLAINQAFTGTFGYPAADIVGRRVRDIEAYATSSDRIRTRDMLAQTGRIASDQVQLRTRTGEIRDIRWSIVPVSHAGTPCRLVVMEDITEHARVAARLRATQDLFSRAFRSSPLPSGIVRVSDKQFIDVNDAYCRTFGYAREQLVGRDMREFSQFVDINVRNELFRLVLAGEPVHDREVLCQTSAYEIRYVVASLEVIEVDGERAILGVFQDVSDRKRQDAALRESEQRFAAAFFATPLPSIIVRMSDSTFVNVNDAFVSLFGYSRADLLGRTTTSFPFHRPGTPAGSLLAAGKAGRMRDVEASLQTRDGRPLDMLCSAEIVQLNGQPHLIGVFNDMTARRATERMFRDLAENVQEVFWITSPNFERVEYISPAYERVWGRACDSLYAHPHSWLDAIVPEDRSRILSTISDLTQADLTYSYRVERPDGSIRWILDRASVVRDETGKILRRVGIARDMTEFMQLEDQLRQAQKLESLGMLAGGIAHDFNNVLAVIASCASLLTDTIPPQHEDRELVDDIDHAVQRASALTRQLLAFSRKQVTLPKVIDINVAVNETRKMLRRMLGEDIVLSTSLDPELGHVRVDPGHFVQVLMNLAVNARDAMPRGGTLMLTTRNDTSETGERSVMLAVRDTGSGIPGEVIQHIFEPFFTTKDPGKGTGMGLAVVHGIVDQAGGRITVDSAPGSGTTFTIHLPVVDEATDSGRDVADALARGTETILLVDDDDHVRRAAARALRSRGFSVVEAFDATAALREIDRATPIDLLLTDVVMPGMDGRELAEAARTKQPGLKILYTSGYTDDAVVRHGVAHGEVAFIEKPFRPESLASKVRQTLDV